MQPVTKLEQIRGDTLALWVHRYVPWGCIYGEILTNLTVFFVFWGVHLHPQLTTYLRPCMQLTAYQIFSNLET